MIWFWLKGEEVGRICQFIIIPLLSQWRNSPGYMSLTGDSGMFWCWWENREYPEKTHPSTRENMQTSHIKAPSVLGNRPLDLVAMQQQCYLLRRIYSILLVFYSKKKSRRKWAAQNLNNTQEVTLSAVINLESARVSRLVSLCWTEINQDFKSCCIVVV